MYPKTPPIARAMAGISIVSQSEPADSTFTTQIKLIVTINGNKMYRIKVFIDFSEESDTHFIL